MAMKRLLMGAEVEYSMAASVPQGALRRGEFHETLLDALREEHAWLPDMRTPAGIYIDNGSRYYLDAGYHNEFSTPEVAAPREIAVYDRANEQILQRAKATVKERSGALDICLTKNNVNFSAPSRAAWGQHEAYMCWIPLESAAKQLIPHLVSRLSYAGSGCLTASAQGFGYELSQRAPHMTRLTGRETTQQRAIFCTRAWKPSDVSTDGWTRTNLICKDSQRCSFGMYLSYGVTALLFMIMNQGHIIGKHVQLKDAVSTMRAFSLDPLLKTKAPLVSGNKATSLDIQRAYLREAKPHVESGDYPDWTAEVFEHWERTLDQLVSNPLQLDRRLDTYVKLRIFDRQLRRAGLNWKKLRDALKTLQSLRSKAPEHVVQAILNESSDGLDAEAKSLYEQLANGSSVRRCGLERLRFAVRMQALELSYHELGGMFDQLLANGYIDSVVVTDEEVQHAMHHPPVGGRAQQRSRAIEQFDGSDGWVCDWQYAVNERAQQWVDLQDPFINECRVTPLSPGMRQARRNMRHDAVSVRLAE